MLDLLLYTWQPDWRLLDTSLAKFWKNTNPVFDDKRVSLAQILAHRICNSDFFDFGANPPPLWDKFPKFTDFFILTPSLSSGIFILMPSFISRYSLERKAKYIIFQ